MKTVEERLRAAAEETRRYAARQWPPDPKEERTDRARDWLVVAGAFAVVVALFAVPGVLTSVLPGGRTTASEPLPTPGSVQTTLGTAPSTTVAACSAAGTPAPTSAPSVPQAVETTRQAILSAAVGCDLDALVGLAAPDFVTSFGGGGAENLRLWESEGKGRLDVLLLLLDMKSAVVSDGQGGDIYVWPAAYSHDSWEDIPQAEIEELYALYTEQELDEIAQLGAYGGWRTGIDEDGNWLYFVAGD